MASSRKLERFASDYDDIEYQSTYENLLDEYSIKKKRKLDPYNKGKERRNSKINPRFIEIEDNDFDNIDGDF